MLFIKKRELKLIIDNIHTSMSFIYFVRTKNKSLEVNFASRCMMMTPTLLNSHHQLEITDSTSHYLFVMLITWYIF